MEDLKYIVIELVETAPAKVIHNSLIVNLPGALQIGFFAIWKNCITDYQMLTGFVSKIHP
jgi:fluoride ion exporter CrcB/FEX